MAWSPRCLWAASRTGEAGAGGSHHKGGERRVSPGRQAGGQRHPGLTRRQPWAGRHKRPVYEGAWRGRCFSPCGDGGERPVFSPREHHADTCGVSRDIFLKFSSGTRTCQPCKALRTLPSPSSPCLSFQRLSLHLRATNLVQANVFSRQILIEDGRRLDYCLVSIYCPPRPTHCRKPFPRPPPGRGLSRVTVLTKGSEQT